MNKLPYPEVTDCDYENISTVVRPVGPWRFLTPIDTVALGDLGRIVPHRHMEAVEHLANWSPVTDKWRATGLDGDMLGANVGQQVRWEFIRAVDETSHTVPMYEEP